jgi:hypothetical protein
MIFRCFRDYPYAILKKTTEQLFISVYAKHTER